MIEKGVVKRTKMKKILSVPVVDKIGFKTPIVIRVIAAFLWKSLTSPSL